MVKSRKWDSKQDRNVAKNRKWDKVRAEIKPEFERLGITTCELKWSGCFNYTFLGFAHSKRRRFIKTDEEMREVILACQRCHETLDRKTHEETERIVKEVIRGRMI